MTPVAIDYPAALVLRQMAMQHDDYPKYLLAPEVSALLHYVPDLHRRMLLATLKIPLERRNRRTGRTEKARLWEITDRTVRTWIREAVEAAAADGVTFSVPVTPHTFRHSYAMHMLYAGIPLKVLQSLMGHKSVSSTEVYTKVFALDVAARHRVQFQMPGADAVAMLKGTA
ncbi:phage integrase family protein [Salmonella enterica subsp. salamae]|nr:phage integrase family protein [Salmonella enterica subsp. salamae]ECI3497648.1 resolvase [Salmonella enterica subsp. salamae]EDV9723192.1 phage integrase family protein [Salmonella enterica subsp. salamae]